MAQQPVSLPQELTAVLAQLKAQIRRYVLIEGLALVVALLGSLFWLSFGLDHVWFSISRLELPVWFRATFDVLVLTFMAFILLSWVGVRFFRSFRAKALALVLERRFPQLDDRLVTAVEMAESTDSQASDISRALLQRTLDEAVRLTRLINLKDVFNPQPLQRAVAGACVILVSITGLGIVNQAALATWKSSFVDLDPAYWNRTVGLTVKVLAQPGDIVREFKNGSYKHARGADLSLLIVADEGKVVPDQIQLRYRIAGGRTVGTVIRAREGEREFRHSIAGVLDQVEIWVYGGDFVNRRPYRVEVVEPPRLDRIELQCLYPDYTGMTNPEARPGEKLRDPVAVRGTQVTIPMETDFRLEATSNKPLRRVRVQLASQEIEIDATGSEMMCRIVTQSADPQQPARVDSFALTPEGANAFLDSTRTRVSMPFLLSLLQTEATRKRQLELDEHLRQTNSAQKSNLLVLKPDTQVRIFLEDTDEILTPEPARFVINGVVDQPPVVETKLRGIGTSITRKASIPILGRAADDYGLASVRFEFQINDQPDWTARPLSAGLANGAPTTVVREFKLRRNESEEFERFDTVPLDLSLNQKIVVSVVAEDRDHLNGPHITRGERYTFKVVTNEELLSLLYQRELNLRRRFEQIINESKETQQDLIRHRARADERTRLGNPSDAESKAKLASLSSAILASAERSLHAVRKSANENASVELAFRDIREELVNNDLHTPQTLERLDDRIVKPLHAINDRDYPAVDEALGLYRLANNKGQDPTAAIDVSVASLGVLITNMERILNEMRKLETFQEALEQLKSIIEEQERLTEKTKKERKKNLLKDL